MRTAEYLKKWIPTLYNLKPEQRGFRSRCVQELSAITGISIATIDRNWGASPDFEGSPLYLESLLDAQDVVNTAYLTRLTQQGRATPIK